jgi:acyl carrier protein
MSDTLERIKKLVAEHLGVEEEKVTPTSLFIEDLGADSLDQVEIMMMVEEEFNLEIPDAEARKVLNVQQAVDYVEAHR